MQHHPQTLYKAHSRLSDPGDYTVAFNPVSASVSTIVSAVQAVLIHDSMGPLLCDDPPADIATASRETVPIARRLAQIFERDPAPLSHPRAQARRVVGTCRDFALMTCSALRHAGIAARVRCGFAAYFHPPTYEDHWICEYWDDARSRWVKVDAQLDDRHRRHLAIAFDPCDLPESAFLFSWQAWDRAAKTPGSEMDFGHGPAQGAWFIRVNLARDLLTLCNQETSDWDRWREQSEQDKRMSDAALAECETLARMAQTLSQAQDLTPDMLDEAKNLCGAPHWLGARRAESATRSD